MSAERCCTMYVYLYAYVCMYIFTDDSARIFIYFSVR